MSDLTSIPGVGVNMERHLQGIGVNCVADLVGRDPEEMYLQDSLNHNGHVDKCVLYVYRLAVYYAENERRDRELLKWWNWKDRPYKRGE